MDGPQWKLQLNYVCNMYSLLIAQKETKGVEVIRQKAFLGTL